ncbi:neocarzinostatin apoprotein domain-containing protein [Dactylosporangium roseum]
MELSTMKLSNNNIRRVAALGLMILAALALAAGPAAAATPKLSAKSSGLNAAGEMINVTGSGFAPNTGLYLALCDSAVPNGGACDLTNFKQITTNGSGGFSASMKVVAKFGTTDCATAKCVLMTNEPANPRSTTNVATLAVSFAAGAPRPSANTSATPLPTEVTAGQAETGSRLTVAWIMGGLALVAVAAGVLLYRRSRATQR